MSPAHNGSLVHLVTSPLALRCKSQKKRAASGPPVVQLFRDSLPRPTRSLIGHQNGVDHVNHAIRLVDVCNRNRSHSALFVGQHDVLAMKAGLQRSAANRLQSCRAVPCLDGFG